MRFAIATFLAASALSTAASAQSLTPAQIHGKELFTATCAFCHDARGHATRLIKKRIGAGEAVLDARTDLNADYIRAAVRHGVGSMPWFRRSELSDAELGDVTAYITRNTAPARP